MIGHYMSDIGYGQTQEQLCATVQRMLDKDGPFYRLLGVWVTNTHPCEFTISCTCGFIHREKLVVQISKMSPYETTRVTSGRAFSCTSERLDKWYKDFSYFMERHGLQKQPQCCR